MHINLLINDADYREAFLEVAATLDINLVCTVLTDDRKEEVQENSIFITDHSVDGLDDSRTLYLTHSSNMTKEFIAMDKHAISKYSSILNIIPILQDMHYALTGELEHCSTIGRVFAVIGDSECIDYSRYCKRIASELIYSGRKSVCIIPLKYLNEYGRREFPKTNYSRLMYYLKVKKEWNTREFFEEDERGIWYFKQPCGFNPMMYKEFGDLGDFFKEVLDRFDDVVLDIGSVISNNNIGAVLSANYCFCLITKPAGEYLNTFFDNRIYDDFRKILLSDGPDSAELQISDNISSIRR